MKPARVVLGLLIGGVFAWLTLRGADVGAVWRAAQTAAPWAVACGLAAVGLAFALRIARWELMLRAYRPDLPPGAGAAPLLIAFAANNVLPLRAGDLIRAFAFAGGLRIRPAGLLSTLLVERILDLVALVALLAVGFAALAATDRAGLISWGLAGSAAVALGGALVLLAAPRPLAGLLVALARHGRLRRSKPARRLLRFAARVAFSILHLKGRAWPLLALSLAAWVCEGTVFWFVAAGLGGTAGWGAWFALAWGNLGTLLPGPPGHMGTYDFFATQALVRWGASAEAATAQVLVTHAILWLAVTSAGALAYLAAWPSRKGTRG